MEAQLDGLRSISRNKIVKDKIEKLIKEGNRELSDQNQQRWNSRNNRFLDDFNELTRHIMEEWGIGAGATRLYLTLDKKAFPRLDYCVRRKIELPLRLRGKPFEEEDSEGVAFTGLDYKKAYAEQNRKIIAFLEENLELLPNSAKRYVKYKLTQSKAPEMEKIANAFEGKVFEQTLKDEADIVELNAALNTFNRPKDTLERSLSCLFFEKSMHSKYGDDIKRRKELADIAKRGTRNLYKSLKTSVSEIGIKKGPRRDLEGLKRLSRIMSTERGAIERVAEIAAARAKDEDSFPLLNFLFWTSRNPETKDFIDMKIDHLLCDTLANKFFKFFKTSGENRRAIREEAKKQFLDEHEDLKWMKENNTA